MNLRDNDATSHQLFHSISAFFRPSNLRSHSGKTLRANKQRKKDSNANTYQILEPRRVLSAYFPAYADGQFTLGTTDTATPYALSDTFKLQTNPNATKTIYLDFTGHHSHSNAWNHNIAFPRYDTDGKTAFSDTELGDIQRIFQNVAEDFAPFDVNVTTQDPGHLALVRDSGGDEEFGVRVVLTQATSGFGNGWGGLAKRGSFDARNDTPVFAFAKLGFNNTALAASHEVGHALGVEHDGLDDAEYHPGTGSGETGWGPILGAPYFKNLTQWSNGDYSGSTNREDDIRIITNSTNGINFRADTAGGTLVTARDLTFNGNNVFNWGIIGQRSDIDTYRFTTSGGKIDLDINPFGENPNLDIQAQLFNSSGDLLLSSNPYSELDASLTRTLAAGTYYVKIDGVGRVNSYSDYGSLGFYTINGAITPNAPDPPTEPDVDTDSEQTVGQSGIIDNITSSWKTIQLSRTYDYPTVIVGPASTHADTPATVEVRNITSTSFQVRIQEWDYQDGNHIGESAGYLVLEKGTHELSDGTTVIAGSAYVNQDFRRIGFGGHFSKNPVVLAQTTTQNGESAITPRIKATKTGSFDIRLQEEEANDQAHKSELVHWIAFDRKVSDASLLIEALNTPLNVTHQDYTLNFKQDFSSTPVLLANLQTYQGIDTANIRVDRIDRNGVNLHVDEETSHDSELAHTPEVVGYVAVAAGTIHSVNHSLNSLATSSFSPVNSNTTSKISLVQRTSTDAFESTDLLAGVSLDDDSLIEILAALDTELALRSESRPIDAHDQQQNTDGQSDTETNLELLQQLSVWI